MRTYGRINGKWVEVITDENGFDDAVWITTLAQCTKLAPGESPFHADYGIPAQSSVIQQVLPTYYVARLQKQFAPYFANLVISATSDNPPTYQINALTNSGAQLITQVAL
ncbi:hypothetical protein [Martelella alba]|uniref:Uncharacterized protein n=1 Tax=Martelella alba TaxID=2590451 RepID=A0ABY2SRF0_9HYPH|nr:hypothetical protein [Martelella alba]TKI08337.1 hypothetical protein FCN80_04120 [Martelella alba]